MSRVLTWLSRKSSVYIFALMWAALLAGVTLSELNLPSPLRAAGAATVITILYGYPFAIIFGFPSPYSTAVSRRVSGLAALVLLAACSVAAIAPTAHYETSGVLGNLLGLLLGALVFSPFFIATHVLGEARRALGSYQPTDSIGAWIALFYFPFGGVFFLHRTVAVTAEAVRARASAGERHAV